jgi:hypothetical protein
MLGQASAAHADVSEHPADTQSNSTARRRARLAPVIEIVDFM